MRGRVIIGVNNQTLPGSADAGPRPLPWEGFDGTGGRRAFQPVRGNAFHRAASLARSAPHTARCIDLGNASAKSHTRVGFPKKGPQAPVAPPSWVCHNGNTSKNVARTAASGTTGHGATYAFSFRRYRSAATAVGSAPLTRRAPSIPDQWCLRTSVWSQSRVPASGENQTLGTRANVSKGREALLRGDPSGRTEVRVKAIIASRFLKCCCGRAIRACEQTQTFGEMQTGGSLEQASERPRPLRSSASDARFGDVKRRAKTRRAAAMPASVTAISRS